LRTDELLAALATNAGPAPTRRGPARITIALMGGVSASTLACLTCLGANPALLTMGTGLAVKLAYVIGVLATTAWWLGRAGRPGADWRRAASAALVVAAVMAFWAAISVWQAPADARSTLLLGQSWTSCPWRVAVLSVPAWALAMWALSGMAPTRPHLAGFAAGLFAGSVGALGYAIFCPEVSPAFVSAWYTLGMLIPAFIGALAGPRLLRW